MFRSPGVGMQRGGRSPSLEVTSLSKAKPRPPCCGGGEGAALSRRQDRSLQRSLPTGSPAPETSVCPRVAIGLAF